MTEYPKEFLELLESVTAKRPRTVIQHILKNGYITSEELKDVYGYNHPPRAVRDVREYGIPLVTYRVQGSDGRKIAAYKFGDPHEVQNALSKTAGRTVLSKALKQALIEKYGARCFIYLEEMDESKLQVDHRVPYEIGGEHDEKDIDYFMLLSPSANRAKSWTCEHCENWETKNPSFCMRCYWAHPEDYDHVAGKPEKLVSIVFTGDSDISLFYYSGHGYIDSVGGYLVTPDATQHDYGVSLQDVLTIANNSKAKEKIIILDSCYSGFMGNINTSGQQTAIINEGVTILTASRSNETSVESHGHGVFTSLLIEALMGSAADVTGHVTPGGVYAYIDKALGPWEQRPVFKTNVTRFTSLRDVTPQVDLSVIRKLCDYFSSENENLNIDPSYEPTNSPTVTHEVIEPYAVEEHTKIFSDLQKLEGVGLVVPVGEEHMYYAAMKSKACALTAIGKQYWRLVKAGRI